MSPDGSRVYVAETSGNRISVFARNAASGDLTLRRARRARQRRRQHQRRCRRLGLDRRARQGARARHAFRRCRTSSRRRRCSASCPTPRATRASPRSTSIGGQAISAGSVGAVVQQAAADRLDHRAQDPAMPPALTKARRRPSAPGAAWRWPSVASLLFSAAIWLANGQLAGWELAVREPGGPRIYPWQLAEPGFWSHASAWAGYLLHQLTIWAVIWKAQSSRPALHAATLKPINVFALLATARLHAAALRADPPVLRRPRAGRARVDRDVVRDPAAAGRDADGEPPSRPRLRRARGRLRRDRRRRSRAATTATTSPGPRSTPSGTTRWCSPRATRSASSTCSCC